MSESVFERVRVCVSVCVCERVCVFAAAGPSHSSLICEI